MRYLTDDGMTFCNLEVAKKHEEELEQIKNSREMAFPINGKEISMKDIKEFFKLMQNDCSKCPFKPECDDLYNIGWEENTPVSLCRAIKGTISND